MQIAVALQSQSTSRLWVVIYFKLSYEDVISKIRFVRFFLISSNDVDMETEHYSNGVGETSSNGFLNGSSKHDHEMEDCDTEMGLQWYFLHF